MLWRTLQPPLLRYLLVHRGVDREDVASETWLQVVRDLHKFSGDAAAFRAWLFTVARNRALDAHRARARRPVAVVPEEDLAERRGVDDTEAAALEAVSTEAALALLRWLPADQAEAVALRVVAGLDAEAAGAILGKSAGAVRVCAHRGLRTLAGLLPAPDLEQV